MAIAGCMRSQSQRPPHGARTTDEIPKASIFSELLIYELLENAETGSCLGGAEIINFQIGPGPSTFTRIFLSFSSLSHVRANERNAALLTEYTPKPGKPFTDVIDPVIKIDPPSLNSGNAF